MDCSAASVLCINAVTTAAHDEKTKEQPCLALVMSRQSGHTMLSIEQSTFDPPVASKELPAGRLAGDCRLLCGLAN